MDYNEMAPLPKLSGQKFRTAVIWSRTLSRRTSLVRTITSVGPTYSRATKVTGLGRTLLDHLSTFLLFGLGLLPRFLVRYRASPPFHSFVYFPFSLIAFWLRGNNFCAQEKFSWPNVSMAPHETLQR